MLSNVLDIEHQMACQAWMGEDPGAIFFDFKAASPSLARQFMHEALKEMGVPRRIRRYIQALYDDSYGHVTLGARNIVSLI